MTKIPKTQHLPRQVMNGVRDKLSLLWLIVMLNMLYADILAFVSAYITPGAIEQLMRGYSGSVKLSQELLLISAILIEIPILMIFFSRYMGYSFNRWCNISAALLTTIFVIGGLETEPFFLFFACIEVLLMFYILFIAIRWQEVQGDSSIQQQPLAS